MDPSFYEDLAGQRCGLLIVLGDRLNREDVPVIHQFTGARYDALALEEITPTLAHRQIGTTVRVHAGVLALAGVLARAHQAPPASELVRELAAHG
jgi:hypothetical protein